MAGGGRALGPVALVADACGTERGDGCTSSRRTSPRTNRTSASSRRRGSRRSKPSVPNMISRRNITPPTHAESAYPAPQRATSADRLMSRCRFPAHTRNVPRGLMDVNWVHYSIHAREPASQFGAQRHHPRQAFDVSQGARPRGAPGCAKGVFADHMRARSALGGKCGRKAATILSLR